MFDFKTKGTVGSVSSVSCRIGINCECLSIKATLKYAHAQKTKINSSAKMAKGQATQKRATSSLFKINVGTISFERELTQQLLKLFTRSQRQINLPGFECISSICFKPGEEDPGRSLPDSSLSLALSLWEEHRGE